MTFLPKALTDIFETQNDTLNYIFKTKEPEDYGSISINLNNNSSSPVFLELVRESDKKVIQKIATSTTSNILFELIPPGRYMVRAILDTNNNNSWDTGNYLKKLQPESVIYLPITFNLKANWSFSETFVIE